MNPTEATSAMAELLGVFPHLNDAPDAELAVWRQGMVNEPDAAAVAQAIREAKLACKFRVQPADVFDRARRIRAASSDARRNATPFWHAVRRMLGLGENAGEVETWLRYSQSLWLRHRRAIEEAIASAKSCNRTGAVAELDRRAQQALRSVRVQCANYLFGCVETSQVAEQLAQAVGLEGAAFEAAVRDAASVKA